MAPKKVRVRHLSSSSVQEKSADAGWTCPEDREGYTVMHYLLQCLSVHAWAELSGPVERARAPPASSPAAPPVGLYMLILYIYVCVLFTHTGVAESAPIWIYSKVPSSVKNA